MTDNNVNAPKVSSGTSGMPGTNDYKPDYMGGGKSPFTDDNGNPFNDNNGTRPNVNAYAGKSFNDILRPDDDGVVPVKSFEQMERDNKVKTIAIAVIIAIVVCSLGFFLVMKMMELRSNYGAHPDTSMSAPVSPVPEESSSPSSTSTGDTTEKNPVRENKSITETSPDDAMVTITNGSTIAISANNTRLHSITIPNVKDNKISGVETACTMKTHNTNCYMGTATIGDDTIGIYAVNDAKTNAILYSDSDPQTVTVKGAAMSYIVPMTVNGEKQNALVIIMNDQTGVILTAKDADTLKALTDAEDSITVTD